QWAWDRGDVDLARRWWRMLLPPDKGPRAVNVLSYPGPDFDIAEIRARLILCDLMQRRLKRADAGLAAFARRHPTANGTIAGRKGALRQILNDVYSQARDWPAQTSGDALPTFAAGPTRNGTTTAGVDVGGLLWSRKLLWRGPSLKNAKKPRRWGWNPACFPVVDDGTLYVADAHRVFGYRMLDGSPAFPVERDGKRTPEARAVVYSDLAVGRAPRPTEPCVGVPRFTLTIAGGRLYARLGSPVTGRAQTELRAVRSRLVCIDLKRAEGGLVWKVESRTLGTGWEFEGSPLVEGDRLYAVMRRRRPETEIHVGCFDAASGKLLWSRRLGTAIAGGAEGENIVSHLLPTLAEGRLFVSTNLGAIVALDARDGVVDWAVTYPTRTDVDRESRSDPRKRGFGPCLFHDGLVFAAPADSHRLLAVDARTGAPLWQRRLRGGVRHLLGVRSGSLVVSGNRLWGLNPADGKVRWNVGFENPDAYGIGRGVIAGRSVYWPLPKEVLVVDVVSGRLLRRTAVGTLYGGRGGNLSIVKGRLVVAETDRLAVYGERPPGSKRRTVPAVPAADRVLR
ncbi:MAG: PQQ-binding-like beta-propeller repeat protein, partial [Planctomycetaceae bacterium]